MNFDSIVNHVIDIEGGYVDHPSDPGGETKYGITKRVARNHGYDGDMRDLPKKTAKRIYHQAYWTPVKGDQLPSSLAVNLFDAAVNHGVRQAVKFIQRAANVTDDGIMGPVTINAVSRSHEVNTLLSFNAERIRFYTSLDTFDTFGRGWMNRVAKILEFSKYGES